MLLPVSVCFVVVVVVVVVSVVIVISVIITEVPNLFHFFFALLVLHPSSANKQIYVEILMRNENRNVSGQYESDEENGGNTRHTQAKTQHQPMPPNSRAGMHECEKVCFVRSMCSCTRACVYSRGDRLRPYE